MTDPAVSSSSRSVLDETVVQRTDGIAVLYGIALALTIIGGLNWGLVGLLNIDVVATLFGPMTPLTRLVYIVVAIAAIIALGSFGRLRQQRVTLVGR